VEPAALSARRSRGGHLGVGPRSLRQRAAGALAEALDAWLDAVFVPRCLGCDRGGSHFCARCAAGLQPLPPPWCESCGQPVAAAAAAAGGGPRCRECRRRPWPLRGVRSVAALEGPLRRAVHRLKYRRRPGAARVLADLLVPSAIDLAGEAPLLVLPVPLSAARERERGYNQAALLARPLAGRLGLPCRPDLLRRLRETAPQVGLSRAQRRENVRGAFVAGPEVAGWVVLLVDDVTTTGSTLGSAAAACLAAGATAARAVTLAREW
jgi:ComF family protein